MDGAQRGPLDAGEGRGNYARLPDSFRRKAPVVAVYGGGGVAWEERRLASLKGAILAADGRDKSVAEGSSNARRRTLRQLLPPCSSRPESFCSSEPGFPNRSV